MQDTAGKGQFMKTKVVCIGDSITEGFEIGAEENYPAQLQKMLGEDYQVVNKGVCCSTVMNLLLDGEIMALPYVRQERFREALAEKGDIYIFMLGTNDAQDGRDDVEEITHENCNMIRYKEQFKEWYQYIIDRVKEAAPSAKLYLAMPMPVRNCIWRKHQERYLQQLFPYMEEILAENKEMVKIDVHKAFEDLGEEAGCLYLPDNLHPNPAGAELIAKTVYKKIS